jgi:hypothetical protein
VPSFTLLLQQLTAWAKKSWDFAPAKYEYIYDIIEQMTICKYGAR